MTRLLPMTHLQGCRRLCSSGENFPGVFPGEERSNTGLQATVWLMQPQAPCHPPPPELCRVSSPQQSPPPPTPSENKPRATRHSVCQPRLKFDRERPRLGLLGATPRGKPPAWQRAKRSSLSRGPQTASRVRVPSRPETTLQSPITHLVGSRSLQPAGRP